ncbi:MAG: hypothetical protein K0S74_808 [Chlamydiales bacterium]|jgi:hypothetical protein|nr:hypothetical protein [Chlamydiales bacterium]
MKVEKMINPYDDSSFKLGKFIPKKAYFGINQNLPNLPLPLILHVFSFIENEWDQKNISLLSKTVRRLMVSKAYKQLLIFLNSPNKFQDPSLLNMYLKLYVQQLNNHKKVGDENKNKAILNSIFKKYSINNKFPIVMPSVMIRLCEALMAYNEFDLGLLSREIEIQKFENYPLLQKIQQTFEIIKDERRWPQPLPQFTLEEVKKYDIEKITYHDHRYKTSFKRYLNTYPQTHNLFVEIKNVMHETVPKKVLTLFNDDFKALLWLIEKTQSNQKILKSIFRHMSEGLKNNRDFIRQSFQIIGSSALSHAAPEIRQDRIFLIEFIKQDSSVFRLAHARLKKNVGFLLEAFKVNRRLIWDDIFIKSLQNSANNDYEVAYYIVKSLLEYSPAQTNLYNIRERFPHTLVTNKKLELERLKNAFQEVIMNQIENTKFY